ncbi:MAG: IS3 family transposase [Acidimicrobiales bacterium]
MSRYRHVSTMKAEGFSIHAACAAAEVSTSAYYDWMVKAGGPTDAEWDEAILVNEMIEVHRTLDDTYGSPRMTDELARRGFCVNHKRTERLMAEHGLYAKDGRRKKVRTTIPDVTAPPLPDLVRRDFTVGEPGQRTCGDITYIPTDEGWLYLADVLDLGSRRIVGFAMGERMPWELVGSAMEMAIATRGCDVEGMIFHHDRGAQYLSRDFRMLCAKHRIDQSVGRIGSSQDNAVAESFWASLKRELVSRYRFATRADARRAIIAWINHYNAVRLHSSLGNVPPIEWELRFTRSQLQAA